MEKLVLAASLLALGSPVVASPAAGASNFVLVNGTSVPLAELSITRSGAKEWKPLSASSAPNARSPINFKDPDCAFDIRATVDGAGPVTWTGVNLCDVKSVTLKRDDQAGAWIDYE